MHSSPLSPKSSSHLSFLLELHGVGVRSHLKQLRNNIYLWGGRWLPFHPLGPAPDTFTRLRMRPREVSRAAAVLNDYRGWPYQNLGYRNGIWHPTSIPCLFDCEVQKAWAPSPVLGPSASGRSLCWEVWVSSPGRGIPVQVPPGAVSGCSRSQPWQLPGLQGSEGCHCPAWHIGHCAFPRDSGRPWQKSQPLQTQGAFNLGFLEMGEKGVHSILRLVIQLAFHKAVMAT